MICPLNTPELLSSSAKFGESTAKRIYSLYSSFEPSLVSPTESTIIEKIDAAIGDNLEHFQQLYSEYLRPRLKGRTDRDSIVSVFASRVINDPSLPLFPVPNKYYYSSEVTQVNPFHQALDRLSAKFNIPYNVVYDKEDKRKGYYTFDGVNRSVTINLAYATRDTPFHEYLHPFVRLLQKENPELYAAIAEQSSKAFPSLEVEEGVVEYLGRQAAKSTNLFERFLSFLKDLFMRTFPSARQKIVDLSTLSTLGDIMDIIGSNQEISVERETTLTTANQAAAVYAAANSGKISDLFKFREDVIAKIQEESKEYTTNDGTNYYQDATGQDVALRATVFVGDKDLGVFSTKYRDRPDSSALFRAKQIFKDNNLAETDSITISNGKTYTLNDLANYYETIGNEERIKGKLSHAYIEYRMHTDPKLKEQAKIEVDRYLAMLYGNVQDVMTTPFIVELDSQLQTILNITGIQYSVDETKRTQSPDRVAPEVILKSDLLVDAKGMPLATTADGLIQTSNGQIKLVDWKFGAITSDIDTSYYMAYGGKDLGIKDSKLDRAKLELVLRAMILKEKFPQAPFQFLKIVSIGKDGYHNVYMVDMAPYLQLIGNYYKATNPSVYKELQKRGLLQERNYMGVHTLVTKYLHELDKFPSFAEKLQWVENRLNDLTLRQTLGELSRDSIEIKRQRAALSQLYQELTKLPGTNLEKDVQDIPKVFGQLKGISDVEHPMVQTLHQEMLKRRAAKNKEFEDYAKESTRLLSKVLVEDASSMKTRKLIRGILNTATAVGVVSLNPILAFAPLAANIILRRTQRNVSDAFAFMWEFSDDTANPGAYLNTKDYYVVNGQQIPLTAAQKEYRDYVKQSMAKLYSEVMGAPAFVTERGKLLTKAEVMNRPSVLPPDFLPRFPKSIDEARENQAFYSGGFGILDRGKDYFRRNLTSLIEDQYHNNNEKGGLPLKYFAHYNSRIVSDGMHTLDVQRAYNAFMDSLLEKKYMDGLYSVAEGVKNTLELKTDDKGRQKYKELSNWMNSIIKAQVLKTADGLGVTSTPWRIPMPAGLKKVLGIPENKEIIIAQDKFLLMIRSGVTFAGLGFSLVGATFNGVLITITNTMNITKPLISRLMGVPPERIRATEKGASAAYLEYGKHLAKVMTGQGHTSKLWLMAKKFDWLPDNYDYTAGRDDLLVDTTSPSLFKGAYMFHNYVETYGALVHLAMMAKSIHLSDGKKEYSIWDAYEVKDGELVWTKGKRGTTQISEGVFEDLDELNEREIKNMKRAYEKLHGAYRSEERTAIEATIFGQFLFQFKKFFFSYLKNLYASSYQDSTIGQYVLDMDTKRPDNVPVWKWEEEITNGRLRVAASGIMAAARALKTKGEWDQFYGKKDSLSKEQLARRKSLIELANTGMWVMMLSILLGGMFDDDDESYAKKRFERLVYDSSMGLMPMDIFDTVQKPVVAFDRVARTGKAFIEYMGGDETKEGKRKGGAALLRTIPPFSNQMRMIDLIENTDVSEGSFFGIISGAQR